MVRDSQIKGSHAYHIYQEFHGVGTREYDTLQSILEESSRVKPRRVYSFRSWRNYKLTEK